MVCLVSGHETASRFGILGILSTVLFFRESSSLGHGDESMRCGC
jgi:hypothetical protein